MKRGRPPLFPGHRTEVLQVPVRDTDKQKLYATVGKAARPAWLRDAVASKLAQDEPITQVWLEEIGFEKVHMNPDYKGGFFRYFLDVPELQGTNIMVSFGDGYSQKGYLVWLHASFDVVGLEYITTQAQLRQFCHLVTGRSIEECVRLRDAETGTEETHE